MDDSIVSGRRSIADLVAITTGALMWPLAPIWPIATALAACLIGIAFGYIKWRIRPRIVPVLTLSLIAGFITFGVASLIVVRAPAWIPWSGAACLQDVPATTADEIPDRQARESGCPRIKRRELEMVHRDFSFRLALVDVVLPHGLTTILGRPLARTYGHCTTPRGKGDERLRWAQVDPEVIT